MSMTTKEVDLLINTIQENVDKILQKNKKTIGKAYEEMCSEGGLPISLGVKLQGDTVQVKSFVNLSFPIEKFKETIKETIELKQMPLNLDDKKDEKGKGKTKAKDKTELDGPSK